MKPNVNLVSDRDTRLQEVLNRLDSEKLRCYDSETSGLDWRKNHVVGHVLTFSPDPRDSYYLPVRHAGGGNIGGHEGPQDAHGWDGKLHPAEELLIRKLDQQGTTLFGHHMNFDLKFMWRLGFRFEMRVEDTMINAPLLDEWQPKYSLAYLCQAAGVAAKKGERMEEHIAGLFPDLCEVGAKGDRAPMAHYWRLSGSDAMAVEYAEGDGTSTWQLRDWQMPQIAEQGLIKVWDIESRLITILARMTARGIKIDVARLEEVVHYVNSRIETLLNAFPSGFNVKSPRDVQAWCEKHGATDWPVTEARGLPSFPEQWLMTHEAGKQIVAVRQLRTLKNTFFDPMLETHLWQGRVHTTYHQLRGDEYGTVTGRLSSSDPNFHAVSKRNKIIGRLHRSIFTPDHGIWASVDYKQCEPVLLAYYSRCKVLLDDYRNNPKADSHQAVATAANIDRDTGKRVNQTLITGGGKGVLTKKYGIPPDKVDEIWDAYFKAMPEIKELQNTSSKRMRRRGYVMSLLGRRARLRDPNKAYTALNRLLQCGNADIIKVKMVQIDEYLASEGRPMDLINNIHDDLSYDFNEDARQHYEKCLEIMQDFSSEGQPILLDVPLRVDPGEGRNWAEATFGPEQKAA